ncbi:MAG: hypothetical protein ABRQ24_05470 [Syntrophomonadaceae bacterium]
MIDFVGNAFLAALGAFSLLFFMIAIVFYVLKSVGLSNLAARRGIENPWLAWIPVADLYIMGVLVGEMDVFDYHIDNLGLWWPVIFVGGGILSGTPVIGWLVSVVWMLFAIFFIYKFFEIYTDQAVLYTVLSTLLGLLPVFIYVIRNNQPLKSTGRGPST